ncbi:MAG: 30S ribosomal protein S9 [Candidatus Omnitrophota bacterium]
MSEFLATGRRKESIARVRLVNGSGKIFVNGKNPDNYFNRPTQKILAQEPLAVTNTINKYDVHANVTGGGLSGQAGALSLGIARALILSDQALRDILKEHGFLTRDPRMKERKKYGQKGARKRFQWTKR